MIYYKYFLENQGGKFVGCAEDVGVDNSPICSILAQNYGKMNWCGALAYTNLFSYAHYNVLNHFCLYLSHVITGI